MARTTAPSGAHSKSKAKPQMLERVSAESDSKLARALGSVDANTRKKGLQALSQWLSTRRDVSRKDMLKLWKGLFYAFWHSDKSPVQIALAERLAKLVTTLPESVVIVYYEAFLHTMRREWSGIDHLRIDKFMMLVRKFFFCALQRMRDDKWDVATVRSATACWLPEALLPQEAHASNGFAYHLTDLFLVELRRVVTAPEERPGSAALLALLEPFCQALAQSDHEPLMARLKSEVFLAIAREVSSPSEAAPLAELSLVDFSTHLYDLGAGAEIKASNRRACYAMSKLVENTRHAEPKTKAAAAAKKEVVTESKTAPLTKPAAAEGGKPAKANGQQRTANGKAASGAASGAQGKAPTAGQGGKAPTQTQGGKAAAKGAPAPNGKAGTAAPAPASTGKKRKGPAPATNEAAPTPVEEEAAPAVQEAKSPAPSKQAKQGAQASEPAAPAASPKKKAKKQPAAQPSGAPASPEAGPAPAPAEEPSTPNGKPAGPPSTATATPQPSTLKKGVRFSLKRNLVMTIGEPPAPPDVRTPPSSKPKGSALKRSSLLGLKPAVPSRLAKPSTARRLSMPGPASASAASPAKASKQKARRSSLGGGRARASDFF